MTSMRPRDADMRSGLTQAFFWAMFGASSWMLAREVRAEPAAEMLMLWCLPPAVALLGLLATRSRAKAREGLYGWLSRAFAALSFVLLATVFLSWTAPLGRTGSGDAEDWTPLINTLVFGPPSLVALVLGLAFGSLARARRRSREHPD